MARALQEVMGPPQREGAMDRAQQEEGTVLVLVEEVMARARSVDTDPVEVGEAMDFPGQAQAQDRVLPPHIHP